MQSEPDREKEWIRAPATWFSTHGCDGFSETTGRDSLHTCRTEAAIDVYRQNERGVLIRSVMAAYPLMSPLLGEAQWHTMVGHYCEQTPAPVLLEHAGARLLPWLISQTSGRAMLADYRFLPALIRLQWARHCAYHCWRMIPIEPTSAAAWLSSWLSSPPTKRAQMPPPPWQVNSALSLVTSRYPLVEIVDCLTLLSQGKQVELDIDVGERQTLAVWATEVGVEERLVTTSELKLLAWLKRPSNGCRLSEAALTSLLQPLPQVIESGWLVAPQADLSAEMSVAGAHYAI
ncbi:putative DNA-binding domain-containing protein [Corallincola platygyrae]|uniref:DNA-binding domain-containing protein n=1 Tax=Corallincola platygyrae TaxID=1193278 RepID=A0ABW4XPD1_9GAMM